MPTQCRVLSLMSETLSHSVITELYSSLSEDLLSGLLLTQTENSILSSYIQRYSAHTFLFRILNFNVGFRTNCFYTRESF